MTAGNRGGVSADSSVTDIEKTVRADAVGVFKIAVDAMGGDNAPGAIVDGAILAAQKLGCRILLVGQPETLETEIARHSIDEINIEIVPASQVVAMDESPSEAFRKKKDSSITVGVNLVKNGRADAFISAGNTGAVMAAGTLLLRMIPGISRAAIAVILPTSKSASVLLDAGANVDCKAQTLFEFGIMGSVYAGFMLEKDFPKVGVLSIGEEESKGNEISREAASLLRKSSINFTGNIEAKDVYRGGADVIVCDGFIGNISLKISESVAEMIGGGLKEIFSRNWRSKMGYLLLRPYVEEFKKRIDYHEYGGAPLLGLNGTVIISHGSSSEKSIKNAIMQAERFTRMNVISKIREGIEKNTDIGAAVEKKRGFWKQIKDSIHIKSGPSEGIG
ncbi:MAG: phosphate acyltransferase [bacterium]|nr:MAG: phosphate acyltransferase [bacterium]